MDTRTVLIVDNEQGIRSVLGQTLVLSGWQVIAAGSAEAARHLWNLLVEKPAVVVTDVKMESRYAGIALAQEIASASPTTKVVVISGHFAPHTEMPQDCYFIPKPFSSLEVARLLSEMTELPPDSFEWGVFGSQN